VEVPTWDIPAEGALESGPYFFLVPVDDETPVPTPAAGPVKVLPSTGIGTTAQDGSGVMMLIAGTSLVLIAGAGYIASLRRR
jgi:hypothetical protein